MTEEKKDAIPEDLAKDIVDDDMEAAVEKAEQILKAVQPGWTISVYRARPSWCKGFLERLEMLDSEGIDMEYLAQTWGGHVLRIRLCDPTGTYRGGVDIPMYSYPPKKHGRKLNRYAHQEDDDDRRDRPAVQPQVIQAPAPPQPSQAENFGAMMKQAREFMESMIQMKELRPENPHVEQTPIGAGVSNIVEFAEQMKTLREVFGNAEQSLAAPDDQTALFGVLGEVLKAVTSKKEQPAQPRLVQQPNPTQPAQLRSAPDPSQSSDATLREIAKMLAGLDSETATDVFINMISRQPLEKREQTISNFMTRLGFDPELESDQGGDIDDERDQGGRANQDTDSGSDTDTR